jgi:hypothetical protein
MITTLTKLARLPDGRPKQTPQICGVSPALLNAAALPNLPKPRQKIAEVSALPSLTKPLQKIDEVSGLALSFIHHSAVVESVLYHMVRTGGLRCRPRMKQMLRTAATSLPMIDRDAFMAVRELRNAVVHRLVVHAIAVVASQLQAWGVDSIVTEDRRHETL